MEQQKPMTLIKSYFDESFEEFRTDCTDHGDMCFDYGDNSYIVVNECGMYTVYDVYEHSEKLHPKVVKQCESIDELLGKPFLDGMSIKDRYEELKTFTEVYV